jgi:hypothetical protein
MDATLTITRRSLTGMLRSVTVAANRKAREAAELDDNGACEMYARISHDGVELAQRIEAGTIADLSVGGAVDKFVRVARKSGL